MRELIRILVITLFLVSCSHHSVARTGKEHNPRDLVPSESNRVDHSSIVVISEDKKNSVEELLKSVEFVEIPRSDAEQYLQGSSSGWSDNSRLFLVKAVSDDSRGTYSAFYSSGKLRILFNHFGECGQLKKTILLIRLPDSATVDEVKSGCSAAL